MNLQKLFEAQAILDEHILNEHPEIGQNESNLDWKLLALQVELGECANEWRGFKKWSKEQEPRTMLFTWVDGLGKCVESKYDPRLLIENGQFNAFRVKNPLLEEYVDCLHFILSIGIELDLEVEFDWDELASDEKDIAKQFLTVHVAIADLSDYPWIAGSYWRELFEEFYLLGKLLGFTWEQIEQAYYDKNKINHERQESGY
ncbi:dUTP diphosphatase [Lysinibacillus sp. SGAir0095]|uniref:dUTP diphosphatase n=1 Tax=Lysinibacillus sp. SGAir0095 TaxID=2070463 RepID=UPI0010CD3C2A|nr:dUTP diphosphatase [Lysinibacillus sp. SGAir0095]QCR33150.1 dUTPase [Lysinibacillus sp. SGAir0095]